MAQLKILSHLLWHQNMKKHKPFLNVSHPKTNGFTRLHPRWMNMYKIKRLERKLIGSSCHGIKTGVISDRCLRHNFQLSQLRGITGSRVASPFQPLASCPPFSLPWLPPRDHPASWPTPCRSHPTLRPNPAQKHQLRDPANWPTPCRSHPALRPHPGQLDQRRDHAATWPTPCRSHPTLRPSPGQLDQLG